MKFKHIIFIEIFISLIGSIAIIFAINIDLKIAETILGVERTILQNILISVGCSIIASSVISFITTLYLNADSEARSVVETWGLKNIDIRATLNSEINKNLDNMDKGMDIVALGMKNFLDAKKSLLERKVKQGCIIRILTMNPNSEFLERRDIEEGNPSGQIKHEIENMIQWAREINNDPNRKGSGSIEIRGYSGFPQDMYQKIDGYVYVGSLHFGKVSQQTITYEYKPRSKGADYYTEYFLSLWEKDSFSEKIL
jgi:hypothetical protein